MPATIACALPSRFFNWPGLDRSGPNKTALDTYMIGSTDAAAIVDSRARARRQHRDELDALLDTTPVTERERVAVLREVKEHITES
jgi:hypothetical protein